MKMTPARLSFLLAALENEGRIIRPMHSLGWIAGEHRARENIGNDLVALGWIAAVKESGGRNTVRAGMGYLYAVTDTARALLEKSER